MTDKSSVLDWKEWGEHLAGELQEARTVIDKLTRHMNLSSRVAASDRDRLYVLQNYEEALAALCGYVSGWEKE